MGGVREKKAEYFAKLREYLEEYKSLFVVGVDNVSSLTNARSQKGIERQSCRLDG